MLFRSRSRGTFVSVESAAIPWDELAFPVNHWTLRDFLSLNGRDVLQPFTATAEDLLQRMSKVDYHPHFPPPDAVIDTR